MTRPARASARRLHRAAWPDMFANLQSAYAELSRAQVELQRRAAALDEARGLFQIVIESMSEALFLLDRTGHLIRINPAAEAMLGRPAADVLNRPFAEVWGSEDIPTTPWQLLGRAPSGTLPNLELELPPADGRRRVVSVSCGLVRDAPGKIVGLLLVAHDITDRKTAEEALARQALELERSNADLARSNTDLEQFAYVASHDLQEPLRMMASFAQLLAERYRGRLDASADRYIDFVVDGATRMRRLVNDLLAYSRIGTQAAPFAPVDCSFVLAAATANLSVAIQESGASISWGQLPTVRGDETQLVQLFQNVIGNAIKFRADRPPRVEVEAERQGCAYLFRVRDNGIGIAPQYAERIFLIFQRLHSHGKYAGTGIGLAICRRIVERHGGRIWVESEPGVGSTFCFTLADE